MKPSRGLSSTLFSDPHPTAYLAAFAIAGEYRLASLDQDFRQFRADGLDLILLEAA